MVNSLYKLVPKTIFHSLKFIFIALFITGCAGKNGGPKLEDSTDRTASSADQHTSQIAVDWVGSYKGVLPCADCQGIETVLRLKSNLSYELSSHYVGRQDEGERIRKEGHFEWDDSGSKITLDDNKDYQFKVGENKLFKLTQTGALIKGDLAEKYILVKFSSH